jgi:hypothetical protein
LVVVVSESVVLQGQLWNPTKPFQKLLSSASSGRSSKEEEKVERPPDWVHQIKQRQIRLDAERILELVKAYEGGASVRTLTAQYGIHRTTVMAHLERHGVTRRPNRRKLTDRMVAEATQLYNEGWSTVQLGRRFHVDDETVRRALRRVGVVLRPRRGVCFTRPAVEAGAEQELLQGP